MKRRVIHLGRSTPVEMAHKISFQIPYVELKKKWAKIAQYCQSERQIIGPTARPECLLLCSVLHTQRRREAIHCHKRKKGGLPYDVCANGFIPLHCQAPFWNMFARRSRSVYVSTIMTRAARLRILYAFLDPGQFPDIRIYISQQRMLIFDGPYSLYPFEIPFATSMSLKATTLPSWARVRTNVRPILLRYYLRHHFSGYAV